MPSDHCGSSLPIPDDLIVYYTSPLTIKGEKRVVLEDDLPKLYALWAEGRVDMVAEALFNRDHVRELWTDAPARKRQRYEALARHSLGLGERT